MRLVDVCDEPLSRKILYDLLAEREPHQSISHRSMPTWEDHVAFVDSAPYHAWFLIEWDGYLGSIYLTHNDEIGVSLFGKHRGQGYAAKAILLLMRKYPRKRYLANINPANEASIRMFERLGFRHIQNTYELNA